MSSFRCLGVGLLCAVAVARQSYQAKIPNGDKVRDSQNNQVNGVGHINPAGRGLRNPFGLDFAAANFEWTTELCNMDSDCDGYSNGVELGDPQCQWEEGGTPQFDRHITHPGVANTEHPADNILDTCKNYKTNVSGRKSFKAVMPNYTVTTDSTSYIKYGFQSPESADLFITRFRIVNKNPNVVHHMLLYGCGTTFDLTSVQPPQEASMNCETVLMGWAVGGRDFCLPEVEDPDDSDSTKELTIKLVGNSYFVLEIHYDNPQGNAGIVDASGLEFDYVMTSNGLIEAGIDILGSNLGDLTVPPGKEKHHVKATPVYSHNSVKPIYIFAHILHSHGLGRQIWITHNETGQDIACNTAYDFDAQELVPIIEPIRLEADATFEHHCVFDSTSRTEVTEGGAETSQEMCLSMLFYYPKQNGDWIFGGLVTPEVVADGPEKKCTGAVQAPVRTPGGCETTTTTTAEGGGDNLSGAATLYTSIPLFGLIFVL